MPDMAFSLRKLKRLFSSKSKEMLKFVDNNPLTTLVLVIVTCFFACILWVPAHYLYEGLIRINTPEKPHVVEYAYFSHLGQLLTSV